MRSSQVKITHITAPWDVRHLRLTLSCGHTKNEARGSLPLVGDTVTCPTCLTYQCGDRRDGSLMHSLALSREYSAIRAHGVLNGHMQKAFLGMTAREAYIASGRWQRDQDAIRLARRLAFHRQDSDTRDFRYMVALDAQRRCGMGTPAQRLRYNNGV